MAQPGSFKWAVMEAAEQVRCAPLNLTVDKFWKEVKSLVVRRRDGMYQACTVEWFREHSPDTAPEIVLTLAGKDGFDRDVDIRLELD